MAYPLSTQDSSPRFEASRSRAIWGRATLTMKRSRLASTTPAQTMTSTCREEASVRLVSGASSRIVGCVIECTVAGCVLLHNSLGCGCGSRGFGRLGQRSGRPDGTGTEMTVHPSETGQRSFPEVTRVVARAPGHFEAEVDSEWTIGGKPNGGYLLAMVGRTAVAVGGHRHVIAASAHYTSTRPNRARWSSRPNSCEAVDRPARSVAGSPRTARRASKP